MSKITTDSNYVTIRPFTLKDLDEVIALWLRTNISAHHYIPSSYWEQHINDLRDALPKADVKLACLSSTIIGFLGIIEKGYIAGLFVDDTFQRQGIGNLLIKEAQQKHSQLTLHCYSKNKQAISFYQKHDFSIINQTINDETHENECEMQWLKAK